MLRSRRLLTVRSPPSARPTSSWSPPATTRRSRPGLGGRPHAVVRSGPDGADLALVEIVEMEDVAVRFDRIVIASGDGIFAHPAAQLQASGVAVTVVSRPDALSRQLKLAARDIRYLDLMPKLGPAVARRMA